MSHDQYLIQDTPQVDLSVNNEALAQVNDLYALAKAIEAEEVALTEQLKVTKARRAKILEEALPAVLDQYELTTVGTRDGRTITVTTKLYASVPKENKGEVAAWLEEHGHGALVKKSIGVTLPKGESEQANRAVEALSKAGITGITVSDDVNTTSLKSLISELMAQGVDVPLKLMGAYIKREAQIK